MTWHERGLYDSEGRHWTFGEPTIIVLWHSQQLMMAWIHRSKKLPSNRPSLNAIVSQHGDGRLAASLLEHLGVKTIAGSSSSGGRRAMVAMARCVREGNHIGITPDGPKGPVETVKLGAVKLASMTGARLIPVSLQVDRKWTFNTWDSLFLPKPFSTALLAMGQGFKVEANISRERLAEESTRLEEILKRLNEQTAAELNELTSATHRSAQRRKV